MRAYAISVSSSKFLGTEGFSLWQGSPKPSYTQKCKATKLSSTASRLSARDRGFGTPGHVFTALCPACGSIRKGKMLTPGESIC